MDWHNLFEKEELYEYAENITESTENRETMSVLQSELMMNVLYNKCLSVAILWDLLDEEYKRNFAFSQVGEFNYSRFVIVMEFWNKYIVEQKIRYDVEVRSLFRIKQQLGRILKNTSVSDVEFLQVSEDSNDSAIARYIISKINGIELKIKADNDNDYYIVGDGRIGAIEKIDSNG